MILISQPDSCFLFNGEIKSFWTLTDAAILDVLQCLTILLQFVLTRVGTAPLAGDHHDRLGIEQTYGYMLHNSVVYGVVSTVNAFAFLAREIGGKLKPTHLIPATMTDPTVLCMLYYMSYLCANTSCLVETHDNGDKVRQHGMCLGCKGYKGTLHTDETVFAKLWDGWKPGYANIDNLDIFQ